MRKKLSVFLQILIYTMITVLFLPTSVQANLNLADGTASGQWYNPARDGEGFYVEIIDTGGNLQISVAMYSYNEQGDQLWLIGNVPIAEGDIGAAVPVYLVEGPVWGPMYDPADRTGLDEPFGNIVVRFPSCNSALFSVQSNDPVLESGIYPLTRLTDLVGVECKDPPPSTADVATPGQWTGDSMCFFINTEPLEGSTFPAGSWLTNSDLCNGKAVEGEVPGVEVDINGETGPACQASVGCSGDFGISYPGPSTFGQATCWAQRVTAEIYFTSATESVVIVYEDVDGAGTLCVGQVIARPAQ